MSGFPIPAYIELCPANKHWQVPIILESTSGLVMNPFTRTYTGAEANLMHKACSICGATYVTNVEKLWG